MDLNLPILNGREVLAEIRLDPGLKKLPIIILSGSEWEQGLLRELGIPDSCYLVKPMTFQGYLETAARIRDFWLRLVIS
jgi:CheY-like chemotaxis protein